MAKTKEKEIINKSQKDIKASVKYVRVSPYKIRKVADQIRGMMSDQALQRLAIMTQKSARIMYKLIHSCVANGTNNLELESTKLFISKLIVNEGPKIKRSRPRARGRMVAITKPTAHVEVTMSLKGEF
jgi:large subunit ribosomal protein L22